jgi:hypothetical protein
MILKLNSTKQTALPTCKHLKIKYNGTFFMVEYAKMLVIRKNEMIVISK